MSRILAAGAARMKLEAENYEACIAALEAQLAELEAENERLTKEVETAWSARHAWFNAAGEANSRANAAEALSRTGAVKVDRQALNLAISKWATDSDLYITIGDVEALHIAILSALEPAAPEGQQEPVAWRYRYNGKWYVCDSESFARSGWDVTPLYTRPSEQAVTEAAGPFITFANHAVEKTDDGWVWRTSSNERICDWFGPSDFAALKAAMEAGRHD